MNTMPNLYKKREPIHKECKGCNKIVSYKGTNYCSAYAKPSAWWRRGFCLLGSHVVDAGEKGSGKKRVGQQKQKKKSRK